eukprot:4375894-Alexandrium_andersonii.AAC.1
MASRMRFRRMWWCDEGSVCQGMVGWLCSVSLMSASCCGVGVTRGVVIGRRRVGRRELWRVVTVISR